MWPNLIGCNVPFTILLFATLGSIVCSFIIGTETKPCSITYKHHFVPKMSQFHKELAFGNSILHVLNVPTHNIFNKVFSTPILSSNLFTNHKRVQTSSKSDHNADFGSHYSSVIDDTIPPTSIEAWRQRYGTRKTFWGDWTNLQTREFYKTMLPRSLQGNQRLFLH
jgi:hypothetical protein